MRKWKVDYFVVAWNPVAGDEYHGEETTNNPRDDEKFCKKAWHPLQEACGFVIEERGNDANQSSHDGRCCKILYDTWDR